MSHIFRNANLHVSDDDYTVGENKTIFVIGLGREGDGHNEVD